MEVWFKHRAEDKKIDAEVPHDSATYVVLAEKVTCPHCDCEQDTMAGRDQRIDGRRHDLVRAGQPDGIRRRGR